MVYSSSGEVGGVRSPDGDWGRAYSKPELRAGAQGPGAAHTCIVSPKSAAPAGGG
jgi:hypothetical protein